MSQQRKVVADRLGIREVDGVHQLDSKSLLSGMGGLQGILESIVPGTIFVLVFAIFRSQVAAVISGVVSSSAFILARAVRRQSLLNALVGLAGIAIAAFLALRNGGSGRDYFITGFITNFSYGAVLGLSVLVRYPIFGLIVGFAIGEKLEWRKNKYEMRIFSAATLVATSIFAIRLIVELPLYFSNQLESLAIAKLILGLPLYACGLWLCWLLIRGVFRRRAPNTGAPDTQNESASKP